MKNLLTTALAALLCSCGGANYTITGRYELPPGDSVYLLASDNTVLAAGVVNADTTVSLQGTVTTPDLVFLANAKRTNHPAWLFLEPGKIRIEKYDPAFGYVVCGTPLNDRKKAFDEAMYAFGDKLRKGSPGQSLQAILAEMNALYTRPPHGALSANPIPIFPVKTPPERPLRSRHSQVPAAGCCSTSGPHGVRPA